MANEKTPLELIQETALIALGPALNKGEALALKGFLVQAFDAGSRAQQELNDAHSRIEPWWDH